MSVSAMEIAIETCVPRTIAPPAPPPTTADDPCVKIRRAASTQTLLIVTPCFAEIGHNNIAARFSQFAGNGIPDTGFLARACHQGCFMS